MIDAMRSKDVVKLSVMRGLLSSFTNEAVAKGKKPDETLSDEEALSVISRAVKQRKDSVEQFEKGGRADLVEAEKAELAILQQYLPAQMSSAEIEAFVKSKIEAEKPEKEKGNQFLGSLMRELKGKADGNIVRETVDKLLA